MGDRINVERMGFGVLANSELSDDKRGSCNVLQPVHCPRSWALLAMIPYEAGELLFQVVRYEPKGFRQRRPDGEGGWHWSLGETVRVLYRLSEVTEAVALERTIFITEGEKALDALAKLGIPATCSPGGAWRDEYSQYLADANRCFAEFCQDLGVKSLSAREGVIGRYLDKLIEQGASYAKVRLVVNAIGHRHRLADLFDVSEFPLIQAILLFMQRTAKAKKGNGTTTLKGN